MERLIELPASTTMADIKSALNTFYHPSVKSEDSTELVMTLGNKLRYHFLGIYVGSDFDAPTRVTAKRGEVVQILLESDIITLVENGKLRRFYERTFDRVEQALVASS